MLDEKYVRKFRTRTSALCAIKSIDEIEINKLLLELYLPEIDSEISELAKKIEKMITLAKVDEQKFKSSLYVFFKENAKYIKKNKLYKKFFYFLLDIEILYRKKGVSNEILNCYMSLLMEQATYLCPLGKTIVGLDSNDKPMYIADPYPFLDYPMMEYEKKYGHKNEFDLEKFKKCCNEYRIDFDEYYNEFNGGISVQERHISNMLSDLSPVITENTKDMLPIPFHKVQIEPCEIFYKRSYFSIPFLQDQIENRKYKLPESGVEANILNIKGVKSIIFKETEIYKKPFMLYKIKHDDGNYTSGYYSIDDKYFENVYDNYYMVSDLYENYIALRSIVLEIYANLVSDISYNLDTDEQPLKIAKDFKEYFGADVPVVQFMYKGKGKGNIKSSTKSDNKDNSGFTVHLDKSKYIKINKDIDFYIRKLPLGASASEEAKALAASKGFKLKPDETFVKSFVRSCYTKKDK